MTAARPEAGNGIAEGASASDAMATPDGRVFQTSAGVLARTLAHGARATARVLWLALVRAPAKFVVTVWRLAGALDSALWQGVRLGAVRLVALFLGVGRIVAAASADVLAWLPTPAGRAYGAAAGAALMISSLWVIDELRREAALSKTASAPVRPPTDLADPILARIDGRYVRLSEIAAAAEADGQLAPGQRLTAEAAISRGLVEAYIDQRLLARAALDEGAQRDADVIRTLAAARDRILAAAYLERRIEATVTPERVRAVYAAKSDIASLGDEVRARQIVVATQEDADAVLRSLEGGADFASLARTLSTDAPTAERDGDMGFLVRASLTPVFANAVFNTAVGEIAPPFFSDAGWHIVEVTERRSGGGVPFEAVERDLTEFLRLKTVEDSITELKARHDVMMFTPEGEVTLSDRGGYGERP